MHVKEFDTVEMLYAVPKQKSLNLRGIYKPLYSKMTVMHAVTMRGVGMTMQLFNIEIALWSYQFTST